LEFIFFVWLIISLISMVVLYRRKTEKFPADLLPIGADTVRRWFQSDPGLPYCVFHVSRDGFWEMGMNEWMNEIN
jgi:hypothetical protein